MTTAIQDPIQMAPEAVESTQSSMEFADEAVQTEPIGDDDTAETEGLTREEKGKFVIRDAPVEESSDTHIIRPATLAEPALQTEQPSPNPDVQQADEQVHVSQPTLPDTQAKKKKNKKKKGGKKKMHHPERLMKYVLAARVSIRLARYENPQAPPVKLPSRIAALDASSSSRNKALLGSQFHPQGVRSGDSQLVPDPSASSGYGTSFPYASTSAQPGTSLPPEPPSVPASSQSGPLLPPAPTDVSRSSQSGPPVPAVPTDGRPTATRPSFQDIRWAYATHTEADIQLSKYNVFLFEKIPPVEGAPISYPEPYHELSEAPPIIISRAEAVNDVPAVHFTGDPNYPGDTLMHILPAATLRPDARVHPGHPDYLHEHLLRDYQAVEIATGQPVWRHDREYLDCRHPECKKKVVDWNRDTIICLGCGPKTYTRYC